MGESHTILKIIIFLGIVFLLIGAISPGGNTAWNSFSTSISNFPQFNNPFDQNSKVSDFILIPAKANNGPTGGGGESDQFTGCSVGWKCVQDLNGTDKESSYITLEPFAIPQINDHLTVDLPGTPTGQHLIEGSIEFWCRGNGDDVTASGNIKQWNGASYDNVYISPGIWGVCPQGFFGLTSYAFKWRSGGGAVDGSTHDFPFTLLIEVGGQNTANASFSTARVRVSMTDAATGCSGGDFFSNIGCQFGQFFDFLIHIGQFVINGLIFIGQILIWFANIVITFIAAIAFLTAIPGAPPIIQGIVGVLVVGFIAFIAIVMMGKIRGTGNVG